MTIEERIEQLENKIRLIESRHDLEDDEVLRVKAAISQAAKKSIEDLFVEQSK